MKNYSLYLEAINNNIVISELFLLSKLYERMTLNTGNKMNEIVV